MRANGLETSEGFKTVRCRLEYGTSGEKDLRIESFFFEKAKTSRRSYAAWYIYFLFLKIKMWHFSGYYP
jgi:hypothetical protein